MPRDEKPKPMFSPTFHFKTVGICMQQLKNREANELRGQ